MKYWGIVWISFTEHLLEWMLELRFDLEGLDEVFSKSHCL